jgi:hypothetical protein
MTPEDLAKDMYRFLEAAGQLQKFKDWALDNNVYSEEDIDEIDNIINEL